MSRILAREAKERWDLFNEINRTKKKLSLEDLSLHENLKHIHQLKMRKSLKVYLN